MKAKFLMLASFIFVFFVSCDSSSIDESEPVAAATSSELAKAVVERPISISIVGTDTPTGCYQAGSGKISRRASACPLREARYRAQ